MINSQVILDRLEEMDENPNLLSELREIDLHKFQNEPKIYKLAERCLEISIECLLDICHYIIANNNWTRPKDNSEAIITLGEKGILPLNFAQKIVGMANLRNILVHVYLKIDRSVLYQNIQRIDDFRQFQKHILPYLKKA